MPTLKAVNGEAVSKRVALLSDCCPFCPAPRARNQFRFRPCEPGQFYQSEKCRKLSTLTLALSIEMDHLQFFRLALDADSCFHHMRF
jgi:hypothetical protein